MKLELKDENDSTGVFIELPVEQLKEELGLGSLSVADPSATEPEIPTDTKEFFVVRKY